MANKSTNGPTFAQKKQQEAQQRRAEEQRRKTILYSAIGGVALLALLALAIWFSSRPRTPNTTTSAETTTSASYGETEVAAQTTPVVEQATSAPVMTSDPANFMQIESDRPLAEVSPPARDAYYSAYPEMTLDPDKEYEAVIVTSKGEMRLRLFAQQSPLAVNNFVFLATQGFFDGTSFHRVLEGFMAQGGDPTGTGMGGPGYQFNNESAEELTFDRRGLLAMANAGANTNGSQFFITFAPAEWLNGGYTIFGELIGGDEVLSSIRLRDPDSDPNPGDLIERVDIYVTK